MLHPKLIYSIIVFYYRILTKIDIFGYETAIKDVRMEDS